MCRLALIGEEYSWPGMGTIAEIVAIAPPLRHSAVILEFHFLHFDWSLMLPQARRHRRDFALT